MDDRWLRVIGSNGKTAMGLVGCPWAICDEPGAWETTGGQLLFDAIETAKGKPGSPLRSLYLGTLAPSTDGWWHELALSKSGRGRAVLCLQGDREKWDSWREVARVNPLTKVSAKFRKQLRAELKAAVADSRLKARFLSYRLNLPSADEATMLLTVDDFERMAERDVAEPAGRPIVAIDLGGGRAWSAATAIWQSGRIEAIAVAPGIPANRGTGRPRPGATRHLWASDRYRPVASGTRAEGANAGLALCRDHGRMGRTGDHRLRSLSAWRATRLRERHAGNPARLSMVRSRRRYPGAAPAREGRAAECRAGLEAVACCQSVRRHGEKRRPRERAPCEKGHEQHGA